MGYCINYQVLKEFIPKEILELIPIPNRKEIIINVVQPRKSKLGDFKFQGNLMIPQITVNNDLNLYSFTITLIHELAHFNTVQKFGRSVKPHGSEWRSEFRLLLAPLLKSDVLPIELKKALSNTFEYPRASSCSDFTLQKILGTYDKVKLSSISLENIEDYGLFEFRNRIFQKLKLRRTRYLCKELNTTKHYLIHRLVEVKKHV